MTRFIRYAFMPNRLRYCGGDDNRTLVQYGIENAIDGDLPPLLRRFTGALPYLKLIARANAIADPFDERVVEAYWVGNDLLNGVEARALYDGLLERFGKQMQGRTRELILGKAPAGARPHHSFHVLDIHSRLGELGHSLATVDSCRVSWGRVVSVDAGALLVDRVSLLVRRRQAASVRSASGANNTTGRWSWVHQRGRAWRLGVHPLALGVRGPDRYSAKRSGTLDPPPPRDR